MPFKFVDASPNHNQVIKERIKAEASSHAARISHARRRQSEKTALVRKDSTKAQRSCKGQNCGGEVLTHKPQLKLCCIDSIPSLDQHNISWSCGKIVLREQFDHPLSRPGWNQEDVLDLQFFCQVLGGDVKNLSDGSFFNVVVPCLAESDAGIQNLILATSSAYRNLLSQDQNMEIRALQKCNKAVKILSTGSAIPEISLTTCLMTMMWYLLRMDMKAAARCIHAAEKICCMDSNIRLKQRLQSARKVTKPDNSLQMTNFRETIVGSIAKSGIEFLHGFESSPMPNKQSQQLELTSESLRFHIRDEHDLLSSIEGLASLFHPLMATLPYQGYVDRDSTIAKDLLTRLDEIATYLQQIPPQTERAASAINVIWLWHRYYCIGLHCQILSNSEMSWDQYLDEFGGLMDLYESHICQIQDDSTFVFIHATIILRPLWFTAVHCRDPALRRRAIKLLLQYHRNEAGLDSWFAGHVAAELMQIEECGKLVRFAGDVDVLDRILLRGFEMLDNGLCLVYMPAETDPNTYRHRITIPEDRHDVVHAWTKDEQKSPLSMLSSTIGQFVSEDGLPNSIVPISYDGELVDVLF